MAINAEALDGVTSLDLGNLVAVGGGLQITGNADDATVTSIDLSALTRVGGHFYLDDAYKALTIDLSSLADVGGHLAIIDMLDALAIELPALTDVVGDFDILAARSALSINAAALTKVGGRFRIRGAEEVITIDLTSLSTVADFTLDAVGNVATLVIPALTTVVTGDFLIDDCSLGDLSAPLLANVGDGLGNLGGLGLDVVMFQGASVVSNVEFPALTTTSDFTVRDNATVGNVDLSALINLGNDIRFLDSSTTGNVDLSKLTQIDDLWIQDSSTVGDINFALLTTVASQIEVTSSGAVGAIMTPMLATVGDNFYLQNGAIASMDLSELVSVGTGFRIQDISGMTTLSAPELTNVSDFPARHDFNPDGNPHSIGEHGLKRLRGHRQRRVNVDQRSCSHGRGHQRWRSLHHRQQRYAQHHRLQQFGLCWRRF